jgi:hypothetical protein
VPLDLGVQVLRDPEFSDIELSQNHCLDAIAEKCSMADCNMANTPAAFVSRHKVHDVITSNSLPLTAATATLHKQKGDSLCTLMCVLDLESLTVSCS